MTVRVGMENLIIRLRSMTEASESDYTLAGVTYWTGEQLQSVLDRHRRDLIRVPLRSTYESIASESEYHNYYLDDYTDIEEAGSGTPTWLVEDGNGDAVGTANYTVNYDAGHFRFTTDTEGAAYYLTTRSFNMNRAAVEVWQKKASHVAKAYDFKADGAEYDRSQLYKHAMQMAAHYRSLSGLTISRMFRSDAA